jgi:hypothetical protein
LPLVLLDIRSAWKDELQASSEVTLYRAIYLTEKTYQHTGYYPFKIEDDYTYVDIWMQRAQA